MRVFAGLIKSIACSSESRAVSSFGVVGSEKTFLMTSVIRHCQCAGRSKKFVSTQQKCCMWT